MRKIAVIVGSESDLKQCLVGLKYLQKMGELEYAEVVGVYVSSIHRNTGLTHQLLRNLVNANVEVVITGAGWANHLSGCCDAWLRYTMRTIKLVVVGVAFEDMDNKHTQAAILSISEVPKTQVVYKNKDGQNFVGGEGFRDACDFAVHGTLPVINLPDIKKTRDFSLLEAINVASA